MFERPVKIQYLTNFSAYRQYCNPNFLEFHLLVKEKCNLSFICADEDGLHIKDGEKSICIIDIHHPNLLPKLSEVTISNVNDEVFMRSVVDLILWKDFLDNP